MLVNHQSTPVTTEMKCAEYMLVNQVNPFDHWNKVCRIHVSEPAILCDHWNTAGQPTVNLCDHWQKDTGYMMSDNQPTSVSAETQMVNQQPTPNNFY